jgi:hypothetical protein
MTAAVVWILVAMYTPGPHCTHQVPEYIATYASEAGCRAQADSLAMFKGIAWTCRPEKVQP